MGAETVVRAETVVDSRLAEALDRTDDWTSLSDPAARRKLQNRLNQRARRRRQDPAKSTPLRSRLADVRSGQQVADVSQWTWMAPASKPTVNAIQPPPTTPPYITIHRRHTPDLYFPLSADHLIHLVQLNVYRAFLTNMLSLGRTSFASCSTDLDVGDSRVLSTLSKPKIIPPSLEPTPLQQTSPHPAWIDLFPLPALRDALIRVHGSYDDCALYVDVLGSIGNKTATEDGSSFTTRPFLPSSPRSGVVVWGDPWRIESWELEEGFVQRWGWLLVAAGAHGGCNALLQATDRWRQIRGDDPMDWGECSVGLD